MSNRNIINILFLLSIVLILLDYFQILAPVKRISDTFIIPLKKTIYITQYKLIEIPSILASYSTIKKQQQEAQNLQRDKDKLEYLIKLLSDENQKLRRQLEAPLPSSYQFTPARIISHSRYLEIDVGEKGGVKIGMPVVVEEILIGKVINVSQMRSTIAVVGDSNMKIPAKTEKGARGVVSGLSGSVIFDKVLQKDPLFIGDKVISSGEEGYPVNLLIGNVNFINISDVEVYKQAKLNVLFNLHPDTHVFVVTQY